MNYLKISCGFFLLALMLFYLIYELKISKKIEKDDWMRKSNYIQIYFGIFGLIVFGIVLIYTGVRNSPVGWEFLDQYDVKTELFIE